MEGKKAMEERVKRSDGRERETKRWTQDWAFMGRRLSSAGKQNRSSTARQGKDILISETFKFGWCELLQKSWRKSTSS